MQIIFIFINIFLNKNSVSVSKQFIHYNQIMIFK